VEAILLTEGFAKIVSEYPRAFQETFKEHPLADLLRNGLPELIRRLGEIPPEFTIDGSAGQGQWTRCPWVAVLCFGFLDMRANEKKNRVVTQFDRTLFALVLVAVTGCSWDVYQSVQFFGSPKSAPVVLLSPLRALRAFFAEISLQKRSSKSAPV
jgi:hypothetical protein